MRGLDRRSRIYLVAILVVGAAIRIAFDFGTDGNPFDLQVVIVGLKEHLDHSPLDLYAHNYGAFPVWIYPPGFFAWAWPIGKLASATGIDYGAAVRLLGGACDLGIAWLVQSHLGWRGRAAGTRLLASAAVALGPAFIASSSVHGQIDTVALFPAVLAVVAWERRQHGGGGSGTGVLLGIATAIKQVPGVTLFAFLPSASTRERVRLVLFTGLVPLLLTLPFFIAQPHATVESLRYKGYPGAGGLSILLQPSLARHWLATGFPVDMESTWSGLTDVTQAVAPFVLVAALLVAGVFLLRHRVRPELAACVVFLVVWVFGFNFFLTYVVWGIPFFLLAGAVRSQVALQVFWVVPLVIAYRPIVTDSGPASVTAVDWAYTPSMIVAWVAACVALVVLVRRIQARPVEAISPTESAPSSAA